ncbi:MAG: VOC family protein [Acidimicrobiales bacterium]
MLPDKEPKAGKETWAGENFRVVQVLPPGSGCAIAVMRNPDAIGSAQGLHLVVDDIEAACSEMAGRGVQVSGLFHFEDGAQLPGADAERRDHNTFLSFTDPDGTGWMVQEVGRRQAAAHSAPHSGPGSHSALSH